MSPSSGFSKKQHEKWKTCRGAARPWPVDGQSRKWIVSSCCFLRSKSRPNVFLFLRVSKERKKRKLVTNVSTSHEKNTCCFLNCCCSRAVEQCNISRRLWNAPPRSGCLTCRFHARESTLLFPACRIRIKLASDSSISRSRLSRESTVGRFLTCPRSYRFIFSTVHRSQNVFIPSDR